MKFERWNKDTNEFELVQITPAEYDELLEGFAIMQAEVEIEARIELLKTLNGRHIESFSGDIYENLKEISQYD
jgi:hypothetical protein